MICEQCGKNFHSYSLKAKFCSVGCKADSQRFDLDIEIIKDLYKANFSQTEIACILGTTQKVIWKRMKAFGIKARKQASRNQERENNNNWKYQNISYAAAHKRVESKRGKPRKCSKCKSEKSKRYEWANITGEYLNIDDYIRLCVSCHRKMDSKRRKKTGERTMKNLKNKGGCQ